MTTAQNPENFKVSVTGPDFRILYHCEIRQNKFVTMIIHELLHSA